VLINKITITYLPVASLVNVIQMAVAVAFLLGMHAMSMLHLEFDRSKLLKYSVYCIGFALGLFSNIMALSVTSVETIIVFRACAPLLVSFAEWAFLGQSLPSIRSSIALLAILAGAMLYVGSDTALQLSGVAAYAWAGIYLVTISFNMTYGKYLVSNVKMEVWTRVLYTNGLSIVPTVGLGLITGDQMKLHTVEWSMGGVMFLALSCAMGLAIGYTGIQCQAKVSATAYTIIGIVNKMLTILLSTLLFGKQTSAPQILALALCILGGCFYQQAPKRGELPLLPQDAASSGRSSSSHKKLLEANKREARAPSPTSVAAVVTRP
jgi:GDP-mannose transporter